MYCFKTCEFNPKPLYSMSYMKCTWWAIIRDSTKLWQTSHSEICPQWTRAQPWETQTSLFRSSCLYNTNKMRPSTTAGGRAAAATHTHTNDKTDFSFVYLMFCFLVCRKSLDWLSKAAHRIKLVRAKLCFCLLKPRHFKYSYRPQATSTRTLK